MTKETIGSIGKNEQKIRKNYRTVDDGTIEAMKEYFGVKDHATLVRYVKDVGIKGSTSFSSES